LFSGNNLIPYQKNGRRYRRAFIRESYDAQAYCDRLVVFCFHPWAVAQTMMPPKATGTRYVLPGAAVGDPGHRLQEGRSIYKMEAPSTFYSGTDKRGYPSGEPQNPRTGD
jgi:hypothetical protein